MALAVMAAAAIAVQAQAPAAPAARFVVVLDAAHGGDDAGALLSKDQVHSTKEKDLTLALSVRLRSLLAARGFTVVTTRESDTTVDDQRRAEITNRVRPAACISLHAAGSGSGVHLFLSSLAAAEPARVLPWSTAQAAYVERSIGLAGVLNSALIHTGINTTLGRTALTTIDSMTCPAVAVEVAPEMKSGKAVAVDDPAYQARLAEALAAGLLEWRSAPAGKDRAATAPEEHSKP